MRLHALLDRLLGQQAGGQQHPGVRRIGARGDRRDADVAVADVADGRSRDREPLVEVGRRLVVAALGEWLGEQVVETALDRFEVQTFLGLLGTGDAGANGGQVHLDDLRVVDLALLRDAEHPLRLEVGLDRVAMLFAAGHPVVLERLVVDREEAAGRAVVGRHVGDGRAVGGAERGRALAEVLDELVDHVGLAQQFGDGEHEVGGGDAGIELPGHVHADHVGLEEVVRLAEHRSFGFDAADAPGEHADRIHHRGVRVGADRGVGIIDSVLLPDAARQVLEVNLVADAVARGHHADAGEGLLGPLEEGIALAVALELDLHVPAQCIGGVVHVHHDRVVDDQVHRDQRLDAGRVEVLALRFGAHRSEVVQRGESRHVLQHDARQHERQFIGALAVGLPGGQCLHRVGADSLAVAVAQHRFEHHAQAHRQARGLAKPLLFQRLQRVHPATLAGLQFEFAQGVQRIVGHAGFLSEACA